VAVNLLKIPPDVEKLKTFKKFSAKTEKSLDNFTSRDYTYKMQHNGKKCLIHLFIERILAQFFIKINSFY